MIYAIFESLFETGKLAVFKNISSRTLFAFVTAFFLSLIIGRPLINALYRHGCRSPERDYSEINTKKRTPMMGGILIFITGIGSALLWCDLENPFIWALLASAVWFTVVGFYDDYQKIKGKDADAGLSRLKKFGLECAFGLGLAYFILGYNNSPLPANLAQYFQLPFFKDLLIPSWEFLIGLILLVSVIGILIALYCVTKGFSRFAKFIVPKWIIIIMAIGSPIGIFLLYPGTSPCSADWVSCIASYILIIGLIVYSTNAVNYTDGMDGLVIVPSVFVYIVLGVFAYILGHKNNAQYLLYEYIPKSGEIAVFCGAIVGAGIGFLWFNSHPAEVFMGDTGSLFLGGTMGTAAVLIRQEVVVFLIAGAIFGIEFFSSVIQDYLGIKTLNRRIFFYRTPLHDHFKHQGMAEAKIVTRFWIISAIMAALALITIKLR